MSDSLWPHGLQHTRLPCPSTSPRVCSNSCPLNWWCHPTISSSLFPFSSCPQSSSPSGSFQMSQFFTSGGQSIGVSASASVLPMSIQGWFPFRINWLISLQSRDSQESSPAPHSKASVLRQSALFMAQFSHLYMTTGKTTALTIQTFGLQSNVSAF